MNVISRLTIRQMKQNRRRTAVTILGIVLSVALITAITCFAQSWLDMMKQDAVAANGDWHVCFENMEADAANQLYEQQNVSEIKLSKVQGTAFLPDAKNEYKPYLLVVGADGKQLRDPAVHVLEGRLPENEHELLIPKHLEENGGIHWKVGDTITVGLGTRMLKNEEIPAEPSSEYREEVPEYMKDPVDTTYQVVGIMDRLGTEEYSQASYTAYTYLPAEQILSGEKITARVKVKPLNSDLYPWGNAFASEHQIEVFEYNTSVLSYSMMSGNAAIMKMLNRVKWIMMGIVAAASVAVIYSSFSISLSERSRYLGMLASVGATRTQKRKSVFTEALILGAIGIPLGLLLGFAGVSVTTFCIRGLVKGLLGSSNVVMHVVIPPMGVLGAVMLAIVTILISAWIPAYHASRISPVEAIRQNKEIRLDRKQVRTSKLTQKIFGFEGTLAMKNLKRNKKRYRATVISLVFSIALYLGVASFTAYLRDSYQMAIGADAGYIPDVEVSVSEYSAEKENDIRALCSLSHVEESSVRYEAGTFYMTLDQPEFLTDEAYAAIRDEYQAEGEPLGMGVRICGLDEDSLMKYAEMTGADPDLIKGENGVIIMNALQIRQNGKRSWENQWDMKPGDTISGKYNVYGEDGSISGEKSLSFTVAGLTEKTILGCVKNYSANELQIYTTKETAEKIAAQVYGSNVSASVELKGDDQELLEKEVEAFVSGKEDSLNVYAAYQEFRMVNNLLILMNVFIYGFIILTSLICITSIFNTISTSVSLRIREYAMLKSVGMSPKSFNRMVVYESMFYGLKALIYGLPIGLALMFLIYTTFADAFDSGFYILWKQVVIAVVCVMLAIGSTMWYSVRKVKKENIVDTLRNENI